MATAVPVAVRNPSARAFDPIPEWSRAVYTYEGVQQAELVALDARIAAEAFAPREPFPDSEWIENANLAVHSVQEAMIGTALALIGAAHHHLTTSAPKLFLPKPDLRLTYHHRNALLAIARWRVAQIWFGSVGEPEITVFRSVNPILDAITTAFPSVLDSLPVALCYHMCAREHLRAGGTVKALLDNATPAPDGSKRAHIYWGNAPLKDRLAAYCIMEGDNNAAMYSLLSNELRADLGFNVHLIALGGDEVLSQVAEDVYNKWPIGSAWVLEARSVHYTNNPKRTPWLAVVSVVPKLMFSWF
tara:strand:- start:271 stop:1176 length:906 start_codon:yes stop_codon:yes gene_type:complete